jgi:tetratricopeptide (TPR) repeat protein
MLEAIVVISLVGYIYYLRNYADLRTNSEKEAAALQEGINFYNQSEFQKAFDYFDQKIKAKPKSSVAYLYRALCYKKSGDLDAAKRDLTSGLSYDGTLSPLHLEKGKIEYETQLLADALESFDKAVLYDGDEHEATYHWRGLTNQALGRDIEAQKDFLKESDILKQKLTAGPVAAVKPKDPFLDKRLGINALLLIVTSILIIVMIKHADGIHLPFLLAVFSAITIGIVEPVKGWALAIFQCILLIGGYYLFTKIPENMGRLEVENFSLYGSCVLTFAGSFIGGFLKRAFISG